VAGSDAVVADDHDTAAADDDDAVDVGDDDVDVEALDA
jgi:hypothetical protein